LNWFIKILINKIPRTQLIFWSRIFRPIIDIYYRGTKFEDPINNKLYRKFLPYGYVNQRINALSPGTLSLERHRLLWLYLKNKTDFFNSNLKILHIAPEQAFFKFLKSVNNQNYITFDLNSPLADIKGDICAMPFEDNFFDFILCNHVLEHISDDTKAIRELYRILKPGGYGILQVPQDLTRKKTFEDNSITNKRDRAKIFGQYDHVRIYGQDYFDKLRSGGFKVKAINYTSSFSEKDLIRYCLTKGELIPFVYK